MRRRKTYYSNSYRWELGEIPRCDFCKAPANRTALFETPFNGILVCRSERCAVRLVKREMTDRIKPGPDQPTKRQRERAAAVKALTARLAKP